MLLMIQLCGQIKHLIEKGHVRRSHYTRSFCSLAEFLGLEKLAGLLYIFIFSEDQNLIRTIGPAEGTDSFEPKFLRSSEASSNIVLHFAISSTVILTSVYAMAIIFFSYISKKLYT